MDFNAHLQNSEGEYYDLLQNAHDLIHIVQPDGKMLYVNKSWSRVLEYKQEEIQGSFIGDFIHEDDRQRFNDYRQAVISGTSTDKEIVVKFITHSGRIIYLEGFVSVKNSVDGPLYTRGIFRDVSARMEQELQLQHFTAALIEREASLQQILMNGPDAVIVIDQDNYIIFWNSRAEEMFGWRANEVLGLPLSSTIIPPRYREAHDAGIKRYLATGEARVLNKTIELSALDKQGKEFFISLTVAKTPRMGEVAFTAFVRDITEQKKNQAELEKKTKELEVSNKQLEQFAHVASHDLKEPVRKMRVFLDKLQRDFQSQMPAASIAYLEKAQAAAQRLNSMVEGVLNYSSVRSHHEPFSVIDLGTMMRNIELDLEIVIQQTGAKINYGELPEFEGIPFLIYQLFYNLINNSLKFARTGAAPAITITGTALNRAEALKFFPAGDSQHFIKLEIEDNGIGFSREDAEKIFLTFTRLNSKDQYEGTGLGLALCKSIVDRHYGVISAAGEEGKGAKFTIILPARQVGQ
ncbi:MAG: PAS domain S-box protein [Chitinophagaceae bacterium]|nr:MAG: PAS domain S-box protein [Chitinophagaceae bacterium]